MPNFQDKDRRADVARGEMSAMGVVQPPLLDWSWSFSGGFFRPEAGLSSVRANSAKEEAAPLILLGNGSDAGRFLLIGSLPGQALGDLFEVPPEVGVQRFLGLDRGHFSYLRFSGIVELECAQVAWQILTAILLVAFTESIPRKNR
jgi:hypothetical protein